jgi:hypothetical protein
MWCNVLGGGGCYATKYRNCPCGAMFWKCTVSCPVKNGLQYSRRGSCSANSLSGAMCWVEVVVMQRSTVL